MRDVEREWQYRRDELRRAIYRALKGAPTVWVRRLGKFVVGGKRDVEKKKIERLEILRVLSQLDIEDRLFVSLRYYWGFSFAQVARMMSDKLKRKVYKRTLICREPKLVSMLWNELWCRELVGDYEPVLLNNFDQRSVYA